jgi:hypothetical protein
MLFALIVLLVLLFLFRKPIAAWLKSPSDPFADEITKLEADAAPVFGKRAVPPAASKDDPGVSGEPKV